MRLKAAFLMTVLPVLAAFTAGAQVQAPVEPVDFSHYDATGGFPQVMVSAIVQDSESNIWIASSAENAVIRFDGSHIYTFKADNPEALFTDSSGRVLISSPKQQRILAVDGDRVTVLEGDDNPFSFTPQFFLNLPGGRVFCAGGTMMEILGSASSPSGPSVRMDAPGIVRSCAVVNGVVYVGTVDGNLLSCDGVKAGPVGLADFPSEVNAILSDGRGGLWIGTRKDGLYHCTSGGTVIGKLELDPGAADSGRENILCLEYQSPGKLWIGTKDGLAIYDETSSKVTIHRHGPEKASSLSHNTVRRIMRDNQGGMWLGTYYGGTNYWHPSRNKFLQLRAGKADTELNDHIVNAIREDDFGLIWIGTNSGGINCYDPATGRIRKYLDPQSYNDIISLYPCPGSHDVIYYSNIGGLSRLDPRSGKVVRLCETPYANMLVPAKTGGKLIIWTLNGSCALYSIADNSCIPAPEDEIVSPLPQSADHETDQYGSVWTGTSNGLRCSDGVRTRTFHTFDGLASEHFAMNAHCRAKDGRMYFGGIGGVTVFDPASFATDEDRPAPKISSVVLDGVSPIPFRHGEVLRLRQTKGHYFFHFSVPDYISGKGRKFSYMMEGYDTGWIEAGQDNYAVYTNLPKGTYTLKLADSSNGCNPADGGVCELRLKVIPSWYKTTLAHLLEMFLVLLLCMLGVRRYVRRKEMENKLALHELEARHAHEITRLKALYFINTTAVGETIGNVKDISREEELFITKAMNIVENNIGNPDFTSATLAEKMQVSRMTLHKQMKEMTGGSTLEFIHKIRFTEACRLLKESGLTVSEIAYKLGFGHPTSFISSFKKYIGCTPLEFRQSK